MAEVLLVDHAAVLLPAPRLVRWEDLERDVAIEARVASPVDDAHATLPDLFENAEASQRLVDHGGRHPRSARNDRSSIRCASKW